MKLTATLSLPADTVTRTLAILAQKGAGKTYTGMKMSELMLREKAQLVCLDPTGVWWGLRSSADGERPGLDIIVMGGEHGDVPLEPTAGELVAAFVVESSRSVALDLSHFESNAAQDRFVTSFAEKLFRLKATNRTPLHLMLDEADSFLPQRPAKNQLRMLGAFEAIVRRGRSRGLGMTMISQRPAVVNKNVLTQVDALICHRVTGKQDMDALTAWIKHWSLDPAQAGKFLASLPSLAVGECWFWSPGWLSRFEQGKVNARSTFDSSSTPGPGSTPGKVQMRAVDLSALSAQILATVEHAKANDPRELRQRIATLELALKSHRQHAEEMGALTQELGIEAGGVAGQSIAAVTLRTIRDLRARKPAEVSVLTEEDRNVLKMVCAKFDKAEQLIIGITHDLKMSTEGIAWIKAKVLGAPPPAAHPLPPSHKSKARLINRPEPGVPCGVFTPVEGNGTISPAQRKILTVLAQYHPTPCAKRKVAVIANYKITGGSFNNNLGALRSVGYILSGEPIAISEAGLAALGSFEPIPGGIEAIHAAIATLPRPQAAILEALLRAAPGYARTKESVAEAAGMIARGEPYEVTGGSFLNNLGALRTRELIRGRDPITLLIP